MSYSSYELKYCERCGGLGVRQRQSGLPYCCDCEQMMRAFLPARPAAHTAPGQLRRVIQRSRQRALAPCVNALWAQETVHAS